MLSFFDKQKRSLEKTLPYLLIGGGGLGLWAAITLMVDKITLLKNPQALFPCDLNPIFSCGSVMESLQAQAFGIPNPILGIAGFAIVITVGMGLLAGAKYKRWFWLGLQAGTIFGVSFVHWLIYQSLYRIGALCLYCMVVWAVTIPIFLYTTIYNLDHGYINLGKNHKKITEFMKNHHPKILTTWYLIIIGLILVQFWDFWLSVL